MKPVIALIGRPNVGKSTLFNRLTRTRDALVADLPGLTRDRHYGEGRVGERPFLVIDTGGFEPVAKEGIMHEMAKQTKQAVAEADVVIFLVDGRQGLTPHDKTITDFLRKSGRSVMLVVNKAEGMRYTSVTADFYELGLGDPYVISSAHGDGVADLVEEALDIAFASRPDELNEPENNNKGIKIAIVGRPNVGKSTLMKILSGVYPDYDGKIIYKGEEVRFANPREAQACGIAIIHQELNLIPDLSITENIFLGRELMNAWTVLDKKAMFQKTQELLNRLKLDVGNQVDNRT